MDKQLVFEDLLRSDMKPHIVDIQRSHREDLELMNKNLKGLIPDSELPKCVKGKHGFYPLYPWSEVKSRLAFLRSKNQSTYFWTQLNDAVDWGGIKMGWNNFVKKFAGDYIDPVVLRGSIEIARGLLMFDDIGFIFSLDADQRFTGLMLGVEGCYKGTHSSLCVCEDCHDGKKSLLGYHVLAYFDSSGKSYQDFEREQYYWNGNRELRIGNFFRRLVGLRPKEPYPLGCDLEEPA